MSAREEQAFEFITAGRLDLAERLVRDQLRETPGSAEAHRLLSICLLGKGSSREALAEADEAVRLGPSTWACHLARGRALRSLKRWTEADRELRETLRLAPRAPLAHAALADLLLERGRVEESMSQARAGLAIDPHNLYCLSMLALGLLRAHRVDEAHQLFHDALVDEPTRAHLHSNLGWTLLQRAEPRAAAVELREALRLDPSLAAAKANLDVAESGIRRNANNPYPMRFGVWWSALAPTSRIAIIAALALLGIVWPGFWGAAANPLALEARRPIAARSRELAAGAFMGLWLGSLAAGFVLLAGPALSHPVQTDGIANPPLLWWTMNGHTDPAVYDLGRILAAFRFVAGACLMWALMPALVTVGNARRIAWAIAGAAGLAALCGAIPETGAAGATIGWLAAGGFAFASDSITLKVERAGWKTEVRSVPPATGYDGPLAG